MFAIGPSHTLSLLRISYGVVAKFTSMVLWSSMLGGEKTVVSEVITLFLVTDVQGTSELIVCLLHYERKITDSKHLFTTLIALSLISASREYPLISGRWIHHRQPLLTAEASCN